MIDLPSVDRQQLAQIGGKAAGLWTLLQHGQRIPPTAVLPADIVPQSGEAEPSWLRQSGLEVERWARARGISHVAIRSSATVEDQAKHSYAGIFRSAFAPVEHGRIATALANVVRGAVSPQRTAYEQVIGRGQSGGRLGLVVQATVPARSSGVAFGWHGGRLVEGGWGVSINLVGGVSRGDTAWSKSADAGESDRRVHPKPLAIYPLADREFRPGDTILVDAGDLVEAKVVYVDEDAGLAYVRMPPLAAERTCLHDDLLEKIHDVLDATLPIYPPGVDIEWVEDPDGRLWVVQLRPMTATPGTVYAPGASERTPRLIAGEPGAPGRWRGPVAHPDRIVSYSMADGRVLVCGAAQPELLPAIARAAAIVSSDGGILCHVAIIARELNKPCVLGLPNADDLLRNDEIVDVDGDAGTVQRIATSEPVAGGPSVQRPAASDISFVYPDAVSALSGGNIATCAAVVLVITPYAPAAVFEALDGSYSHTLVAASSPDQQAILTKVLKWRPQTLFGEWTLFARDDFPEELLTRVTDELLVEVRAHDTDGR